MKKSPIRRVSKKRAKDNAVYLKLQKIYLEENPVCHVCNQHPSTQVHHKKSRMYGLLNEKKYFLPVCFYCHNWIHAHPEAAMKAGWLLDRLGNL